ncbi:hypothetical protein ABT264_11250 [Streptomyces virginiae]|uniref:hypothetical protein n=1 Tax=Streptomyces virginiae TaxID=1961 RepID=UPI0033308D34
MTAHSKWGGTRAALQRAEVRQPAPVAEPVAPAVVPEPGTPEHIEALAESEAADAARALEEIEARVMDGDAEVTPEDVESARGFARFKHLRREAAKKRAAELRQERLDAELQERADAFRASVEGLALQDIARLHRVAEDALDALAAACETRDAAIVQGSVRLAAACQSALPIHAAPYASVRLGDESWVPQPAGQLIGRMLHTVAQRHSGLPVSHRPALGAALTPYSSPPGEVERLSAELGAVAKG